MENTDNCFLARRLTNEYFAMLKKTGYGGGVLVVEYKAMQDQSPPVELLGHIGECRRCAKYYENNLAKIMDMELESPNNTGSEKKNLAPPPIKNLALDDGSLIVGKPTSSNPLLPVPQPQPLKRMDVVSTILLVALMIIGITYINMPNKVINFSGWFSLVAGMILGTISLIKMRKNQ